MDAAPHLERMRTHQRISDAFLFAALLTTGLSLGAALAHAYALPTKMLLSGADYFIAQKVYRGWAMLGLLIALQGLALAGTIALNRSASAVRNPAALALSGLVASQFVFWVWTYPANQATENWTQQSAQWEAMRHQWEYSHLGGAVFQLIAFVALIVAALRRQPVRR